MKEGTSTSDSGSVELVSSGPSATHHLAERLGRRLAGGEVLALHGPLGAGKTAFVKGLAAGLGIDPREVTSPTFLLIHEHLGRLRLAHLDAYRVDDPRAFLELGIEDLLDDATVLAVEWAERVAEVLPADRLDIDIEHAGEEERRIHCRATGLRHADLLARLGPPGQGEAD